MHLKGPSGALPARPPHLADDLFPAEDHAGALGEQGEQVELLAGERNRGAVHGHLAGGEFDGDRTQVQRVVGGALVGRLVGAAGRGTPAHRVDAGQQLTGVVRLDDIVVRAEVEAVDAGAHIGARGDHDDGDGAELADPAAHLEAVLVGQPEIEQHHRERFRMVGQQGLERFLAVACVHDGQAVLGEHRGQGRGDMIVVLDEQQSHRASFPGACVQATGHLRRWEVRASRGGHLPAAIRYPAGTPAATVHRRHLGAPLHAECPFAAGSLSSSSPQN